MVRGANPRRPSRPRRRVTPRRRGCAHFRATLEPAVVVRGGFIVDTIKPVTNGRGRWARVPYDAVSDPQLSHAELRVLAAVCLYVNKDTDEAWPSLTTIRAQSAVGRTAQMKALSKLVRLDYLTRRPGRGTSTTYTVNFGERVPLTGTTAQRHTLETADQTAEHDSFAREGLGVSLSDEGVPLSEQGVPLSARTSVAERHTNSPELPIEQPRVSSPIAESVSSKPLPARLFLPLQIVWHANARRRTPFPAETWAIIYERSRLPQKRFLKALEEYCRNGGRRPSSKPRRGDWHVEETDCYDFGNGAAMWDKVARGDTNNGY